MNTPYYDVLIIGNGLASLTLALSLPKNYQIAIIAKHKLVDNASQKAQGGIAAAISKIDSIEKHLEDTLIAGAGLCNKETVFNILSQGPSAIEWLLNYEIPFTRQENNKLHLTREGGHRLYRIAHIEDHTGLSIMQKLYKAILECPNIHIFENTMALDLILNKDKKCQGAYVKRLSSHIEVILANDVVIASGGMGQIYPYTTTPVECTGDGIAMAQRVGCKIENAEFIQFHPTGLASSLTGSVFLISEAVRGEGGILLNQKGIRFMPHYDNRAELAPRDVVARAITQEIIQQENNFVFLDISHKNLNFIKKHFPTIYNYCLSLGLDISKAPIPVSPVQHYTCGGVKVKGIDGQTQIEHLYCLGEAAYTGLHGANRLASNSLLECVVMGRKAANSIINSDRQKIIKSTNNINFDFNITKLTVDKELEMENFSRENLQNLMMQNLGIIRQNKGMELAYQTLSYWTNNMFTPKTKEDFENRNLLICSILVCQAAMIRKENIGAHFNKDLL